MLNAFFLKNFKSFRDARLPLGPLTMLVGANASGKSNLIEALRLLSWIGQGQRLPNIQRALSADDQVIRGRIHEILPEGETTFTLGCEIEAETWNKLTVTLENRDGDLHIAEESVTDRAGGAPLYAVEQKSEGSGGDIRVSYNNFARGGKKPQITCSDQMAVFCQLDTEGRFEAKHEKARKIIPEAAAIFGRELSNMLILDPIPAEMRGYSFPNEWELQSDGKNVSSTIYKLIAPPPPWRRDQFIHHLNKGNIIKFSKFIPEQTTVDISFDTTPRGEVMLTLTETFGGKEREVPAALLSDGTLRVLAIAAAMLSAPEGGLVVIEEIDNGVHPSRAKHLIEKIYEIAKARSLRVLLSTHNPALLDALPDAAVPDAVFCYRDPEQGDSRLVRLADLPDYPELVAQGPLGYLTTSGTLDRFVKHHPGPEDRQKQALAWLESLEDDAL
jgi:predicted ATPase